MLVLFIKTCNVVMTSYHVFRLPVGFACTFLSIYCWIFLLEVPGAQITAHYDMAVVVFGMCAWAELIVEPLWVIAQAFLFIKLRVISEGLAIVVKTMVTVLLVVNFPNWGLISFCVAQVRTGLDVKAFYVSQEKHKVLLPAIFL